MFHEIVDKQRYSISPQKRLREGAPQIVCFTEHLGEYLTRQFFVGIQSQTATSNTPLLIDNTHLHHFETALQATCI